MAENESRCARSSTGVARQRLRDEPENSESGLGNNFHHFPMPEGKPATLKGAAYFRRATAWLCQLQTATPRAREKCRCRDDEIPTQLHDYTAFVDIIEGL